MQHAIFKTIQSEQIRQMASRFRLSETDVLNLWFDSGIEYLNILESRIRRKRTFDAMFRPLMSNPEFRRMGLHSALKGIRHSPHFWEWWGNQFWCTCRLQGAYNDTTELFYRLQFNDALIPIFTLKRIFNGKQNTHSRQGVGSKPAAEASAAGKQAGEAGRRVKHSV